ncbi:MULTISPECIES: hypothetical protein [Peribacillus]|uniref:hypothetical protein n=1 Tax=Peribacillus TaxID=2675229 RepID=UPI0006FF4AD2|nr:MULTISPECIES: hypothetical protein [unclassified Peribacillus]KQU20212.1 hypothetical protein ASG65_03925 [Bacillus sp. Leaf13]KRF65151.1 hypothetical protein ASG99_02890 [Bacillus sp. Soil768D1]MBK5444012.1 hypothetical protein [Peribacillus sp. TH24]MBK5461269.1 hypothetical protein [Peribacillus sp. TH27]MBK5485411.1 hypothetical protein [Peribacillus sp. TH16]
MERELLFVGERLAGFLDAGNSDDSDVVNQGLQLYRQGLVDLKEEAVDTITAEVQDVTRYKARLNLLFPQDGSCTCDSRFICRHQMAVFFSAYSEYASVSDWLSEWNAPKNTTPAQALQQVKRASELLKQVEEKSIILDKSYPSWKQFVNVTFTEQVEPHLGAPTYVIENHIQTYFKRLSSKAPMEREWKLLYHFVTQFCTMQLTLRMIQLHKSQTQTIRVFYALAVDLAEELHETVQPLSRQARPFAFDPFVFSIKEDVAKLLNGGEGLEYEKIDLYREIWSFLFTTSSWRKEELERVKRELPEQYLGTTERTSYSLAAIHLSLLENQDHQAIELLHELKKEACPYIFYWLTLLSESDNRSRAIPFIEFIIAHVQEFLEDLSDYYQRVDFVRTFTTLISSCCYKLKRTDLLEKFYRATLPHSYWNYANFLFEQGQYKKWVEMHIYSDISIDLISSESIKEVVSKEPELILPLYYHAVQEKVSLKNRPAYKQAVRYLKKMRTIYKKSKKEDVFERYILYVADSTKRLRAFQEELKRGKLIDV